MSLNFALVLLISSALACDNAKRVQDTAKVPANAVMVVDNAASQQLDSAARELVAFLRGDVGANRIRLADTVTLFVSPEGGGTHVAYPREQLRLPSTWVVRSGSQRYSFVPRAGVMKLTTKVGRHFNCHEYALASRFPDLARLPHVGVKLEPTGTNSCLQSWNITLVFDTTVGPPRLVAAVYDQWEW